MNSSWLNLNDKVIVVTGGSSGIGEAIVKELLNQGAYVYNADLNPGIEKNKKLKFIRTDVTNAHDIDKLIQMICHAHNRIDGLVNNAGINLPRLLVDDRKSESQYELSIDDYQKMFDVNVKSVFLMSQAIARIMVSQKQGVIVNMSSEAGLEGSRGQSIYSATKGAINGLTRSWAKELGEFNVRVVGVAPGILEKTGLRTSSYEEALAYTRHKTVADVRRGYKSSNTTPLGRSGHLTEVADLVVYFLSERASYITGVTTNVSGGKSRG